MLRIGLPLTTSTLVQHGRYRLFALLIGGTAGAAALGQVHMAFRLVDTVRELALHCAVAADAAAAVGATGRSARVARGVDRCLAWSGLVAFPLCSIMACSVQPLVQIVLGPVWQPAGGAALPLIALTVWLFLAFPAGVAVIARGVPHCALIANVAGMVTMMLGVLLPSGLPTTSGRGVARCAGFIAPYVLLANARVLRTDPFRPLRAGLPMLGAALLATIAAFMLPFALGEPEAPASLIALRLLIAAAVGVPSALLLAGGASPTIRRIRLQLAGAAPLYRGRLDR